MDNEMELTKVMQQILDESLRNLREDVSEIKTDMKETKEEMRQIKTDNTLQDRELKALQKTLEAQEARLNNVESNIARLDNVIITQADRANQSESKKKAAKYDKILDTIFKIAIAVLTTVVSAYVLTHLNLK